MKWTLDSGQWTKNPHRSRCQPQKQAETCGAFWLRTSHFKQIIIVKQTLSMKRKRLWKTALNLAVAKSYVKL